ncbi:hypothetical protein ACKX1W_09780, partial [Acinetobacter baumannii]
MAKNWMFKGFLGDATPDDEIRACINQGKFMIEIAEKISVHDKFHRTLILSGFCLLKIAKIS